MAAARLTSCWSAPAYNGGSVITALLLPVQVESTDDASYPSGWINAGQKEDGSGPNTAVEVETGLTPGTSYIFQVAASKRDRPRRPRYIGRWSTVLSTPPTAAPTLSAVYSEAAGVDMYTLTWSEILHQLGYSGQDNGGQCDLSSELIDSSGRRTRTIPTKWPGLSVATTASVSGLWRYQHANGGLHTSHKCHTATEPGTTYYLPCPRLERGP